MDGVLIALHISLPDSAKHGTLEAEKMAERTLSQWLHWKLRIVLQGGLNIAGYASAEHGVADQEDLCWNSQYGLNTRRGGNEKDKTRTSG
jgi:hypothetical protein